MPREYPKLDRPVSFCVNGGKRTAWAARLSEDVEGAEDGGVAALRRTRANVRWLVRYFEVEGRLPRVGEVTEFTDDHGERWQIRALRQIHRRRYLEFEAVRFGI